MEGNESIILNNTQTTDHLTDHMNLLEAELMKNHRIDPNLYVEYDVKRGLRDSAGKGVLTGLTEISDVCAYLQKILDKEAFDRSGLIYGMGHAVYTLSDPREVILKKFTWELAEEKGLMKEFALYELVERLAGQLIMEHRKLFKNVCANVDFYSGFVYTMLDIPQELFTPIFAIARMPGWSAHRLEELINASKIIRPAYKYVGSHIDFLPIEERE